MNIDFDTINKVFNQDKTVLDNKIDILSVTAASSKIFSQFPNNNNLDYYINIISKYIKENPEDSYTKGQVFSMLSQNGVLDKYINVPEIKSIFEDFHSSIKDNVSNMLENYKAVSLESMTQNAKIAKANLERILTTLDEITPSNKNLSLPEVLGFIPQDVRELPCNKLNEVIREKDIANSVQSDLLRHIICNGQNSLTGLKSDLNICFNAINSFANYPVKENAIAVNIGCLLSDVVTAKNRFGSNLNIGIQLWDSVSRYTLDEIKSVDFNETRHNCKSVLDKFPDSKEALFVLTQDGELLFSPIKQNGKFIQHIMVANGKPVLNAGMAYFDSNMRMVAISNSSGHYKPTIDRMSHSTLALLTENPNMAILDHTVDKEYSLKDFAKSKMASVLCSIREQKLDKSNTLSLWAQKLKII